MESKLQYIRKQWSQIDALVAAAEVLGAPAEDLANWLIEAQSVLEMYGEEAGVRYLRQKIYQSAFHPHF